MHESDISHASATARASTPTGHRSAEYATARLRAACDAAEIGIWSWSATDDALTWENGGSRRILGLSPEATPITLTQFEREFLAPAASADTPSLTETARGAISRCASFTIEVPVRRTDGNTRWLAISGTEVAAASAGCSSLVGTMRDVTAQKTAEVRTREIEERAAFVRRSSGVGFWYCDLPFDVLQWDDLVKAHFHLPADATVTIDTFYDRIHPDDREPTRQAIAQSIRGHTHYDTHYRTVHPGSGAVTHVRAIGRTFYADDGTPTRFDGVTLDVTEQKRAESELRDADRRKDEFLATLSHELRNPLAPLRNGLEVMRLAGSSGTMEQTRAMMARQVAQLVRLVDDLLDVSRVNSNKVDLRRARIDLRHVVDAAIETSRPVIDQARHELLVWVPDEPLWVDGDLTRLAQVLSNLLNNSAKYMQRGGSIRLAITRDGDTAVVSVTDDGIGIPRDMLETVFELFAQVDRPMERTSGGLGIGLSLVKGLVEMHGGTVEARSQGRDRGSEFLVRLPMVDASLADDGASAPISSRPAT